VLQRKKKQRAQGCEATVLSGQVTLEYANPWGSARFTDLGQCRLNLYRCKVSYYINIARSAPECQMKGK
jgi:hypothetical protein